MILKIIRLRGILFCSLGLLLQCNEQPYEKKVNELLERHFKVEPIIKEIRIDSTASMNLYQKHWKERFSERERRFKEYYENEMNSYQEQLLKIKSQVSGDQSNKTVVYEYSDTITVYENIIYWKKAIDHIPDDEILKIYQKLSNDESTFKFLTVKYQLSSAGETKIQFLVIENDTIFYLSDSRLDKFIKQSVLRIMKEKGISEDVLDRF